ncbi:MAG: hypothetical protein FJ272_05260 [Planctomycetes bacterium]|nr:hypothetical protein [Planctomycetota bacterium]
MKHILLIFALLLIVMGIGGCAAPDVPIRPPIASIYTHYKAPLVTDYSATDFGAKKGKASTTYVFIPWPIWVDFAWKDATFREAAKEANITNVKAADYEYVNVFWLYQELTVQVYGD